MLAVVAIMNRSYGCFKAFVLFQFVNIILLIVGSAFLANYRINNYRGRNYTYIDIVLYVELGLLIWFLLTLIPTCYLWSPLSSKISSLLSIDLKFFQSSLQPCRQKNWPSKSREIIGHGCFEINIFLINLIFELLISSSGFFFTSLQEIQEL